MLSWAYSRVAEDIKEIPFQAVLSRLYETVVFSRLYKTIVLSRLYKTVQDTFFRGDHRGRLRGATDPRIRVAGRVLEQLSSGDHAAHEEQQRRQRKRPTQLFPQQHRTQQ